MNVSKEELIHISKLANIEFKEDEIEKYMADVEDILNFANIVNEANVDDLDITIGANSAKNRFRKDEVVIFEANKEIMANGKDVEQNMFKIPKFVG